MTVAKTDKKTIIFNFLFCKKGTNITESEPFFKFCISNRLLSKLMKWRDTVVTKIPTDNPFYQALSQRHSCIKWWTNNANITKMTKGWQQGDVYGCVHQICSFHVHKIVQTISIWTFYLFSSSSQGKMWTIGNVKRFLLCFAWDSYLQQAVHDIIYVSPFNFFYRGVLDAF